MFILRMTAYLLAMVSFFIFVVDGAQSIAAREVVLTSVAVIGDALFPRWPDAVTIMVGGQVLPQVGNAVELVVMGAPASLAVLMAALIIVVIDQAMQNSLARVKRSLKRH